MISNEQAEKYLKSKEKIKLTKSSFLLYSKKYQTLGLIISKLYPSKVSYPKWTPKYTDVFGNDALFNPWKTNEGLKLARALFGEIRAPYIADIWDLINKLPYQQGYNRRSFRKVPDTDLIENKIKILQYLCISGVNSGFGSMSLFEQIQYDVYHQNHAHAYLIGVVLEKGGEDLDELISDIINAEDEIGGISRSLIKGLLLTKKQKYWEQVGKLLLAAQRQEGLRQTILESLDETQIGALKYMVTIILENDLMRFSSVVRAVDTWFGFGWEAPKKATIKRVLELSLHLLENKTDIDKALESKDFLEIYVALWVLGIEEVDQANVKALNLLYTNTNKNIKLLALFFVRETERTNISLVPYMEKEFGKDIELDYWMLANSPKFELKDAMFKSIKAHADALPAKGKTFESVVFSWKNYTITPKTFYDILIRNASEIQSEILAQNISAIASDSREAFIRKLFPDHYTYYWNISTQKKSTPINSKNLGWKRHVAHQAIQDRNQSVMATGIRLFYAMELQDEELDILEKILERKNKYLREASIQLLIKQPETIVKKRTNNLIVSKKIDQRLAGLEVLTILDEKQLYTNYVTEQVASYNERTSLNKNEQIFLDKFSNTTNALSFTNGFGAIDYNNLSPLIKLKTKFPEKKNILNSLLGKKDRIISRFIDEDKTVKSINKLILLFENNKDFEYQHEGYQGEIETTLLSKHITTITKNKDATPLEKLNNLPLAHIWIDWYNQSKLNDYEMHAAMHYAHEFTNPYGVYGALIPYYKKYIPKLDGLNLKKEHFYYSINRKIYTILNHLSNAYVDQNTLSCFKLDLLEDAIANFPEALKTKNLDTNKWRVNNMFWCDVLLYNNFFSIDETLNIENKKRYWQLQNYLMAQSLGHPKHITILKDALGAPIKKRNFPRPSERDTFQLYNNNTITKDDVLLNTILSESRLFSLDSQHAKNKPYKETLNLPFEIFKPLKKNLLQIELERGELETEASKYINKFYNVEGAHYLFEVLERLGKTNFERGYSYNHTSKTSTFSAIIKGCIPSDTDTFESFSEQLKTSKITKTRLIEVACYATQWANWIGRYLKLDKLEAAVWWFHAHSSEYMSAEKETLISRYSDVAIEQFKKGSLDIDWFYNVYSDLGKANWKLLHNASKYISHGLAHKQIKLYSSVLLNEVKITETLKKIKDKRDKDYVRALGLIPLSKVNPENDLLKRYDLLQTFLKESKQFGSQRQESEKNAVEIGLENLSRNAGYKDSVRFSWAMESKAAQKIMDNATVTIDDTIIKLIVDSNGKASLKVEKNGKTQKSIPKKHQKNKAVLNLKNNKTYLSKQYSRTRLSLEKAMINEDAFSKKELENIMSHPVVNPLLSKLVLFNKATNSSGFWQNSQLLDSDDKLHQLHADDTLVIAHPSHLYQAVQWDLYQRFAFDKKLVQPFKQIFRELYVITDNEKETSNRSQRYQGHQIQPKKTIALLRGRGWTINYEEGLQKVYHKQGFMASMHALADWYSPADIEAPTLEYVAFTSLKNYESIPLASINPLIFSEVMRDIDLVVSVAHVGGVDPEASHSTMEMRAVLAKESARLFKLDNIEVKERHILVKGKLGNYSIHLGSGNISKDGLFLSILPVHSQHRGRLFLPFVDEDPKSAEIISKMKLLAEDNKIQDPTILAQINKK
ncbi:hypothetical protein GCM10022291_04250 [Postechiella marina]|uniref:DUF4132 domain-containing protein n=1 Tax=Postechiella marina TaxID=943941 RepID=A0ABP8C1J8_9FLAO